VNLASRKGANPVGDATFMTHSPLKIAESPIWPECLRGRERLRRERCLYRMPLAHIEPRHHRPTAVYAFVVVLAVIVAFLTAASAWGSRPFVTSRSEPCGQPHFAGFCCAMSVGIWRRSRANSVTSLSAFPA
jgi:hypothetical protein